MYPWIVTEVATMSATKGSEHMCNCIVMYTGLHCEVDRKSVWMSHQATFHELLPGRKKDDLI